MSHRGSAETAGGVRVFEAEVSPAGLFPVQEASPPRGAVRTRGAARAGRRGGAEPIRLDIGKVQVSISAVRDQRKDLVSIKGCASCGGREIAVTLRSPAALVPLDSDMLTIRNQVYRFLVGLLPGDLQVLVDAQPIGDNQGPAIEDRLKITEQSWEEYIENRIEWEVAWQSGDREWQLVCHPESPMKAMLEVAEKLAAARHPLLIHGPSGAGKELLARFLHEKSPVQGPFVACNLAAIPPTLIDSELFGKVPGAHSDARKRQLGYFVRANKGTLFLDEIRELSPDNQAKLLRVIEEGNVKPLGGDDPIPVDVRIIAATNEDLRKDVAEGRFRLDLYYRLGGGWLEVSGLEQRLQDIPAILSRWSQKLSGGRVRFDRDLYKSLFWHRWPGNVRELVNLLKTVMSQHSGGTVDLRRGLSGVQPDTAAGLNQGFDRYMTASGMGLAAEDREIARDLARFTDSFLTEAREEQRTRLTEADLRPLSDKHLKLFEDHLEARCAQALAPSPGSLTSYTLLTAYRTRSSPKENETARERWVLDVLLSALREMKAERGTGQELVSWGNRYALLELFLGQKFDRIRKHRPGISGS